MPTIAAAQVPPKPLQTWAEVMKRPRPAPDATIPYGSDPLQVADLWLPKGRGPFPVVVLVHGGCWTTRMSIRNLTSWMAEDLRRDGIAVWDVEYRGVDRPGGGYPGTFLDVAAAADAVRLNAEKYHLETRRVAAVGHSAGGHLALWLAARAKIPTTSALYVAHPLPIDHAVSLGGLPDLEDAAASPDNGCGTAVVARLVGEPTDTHPDVYADTSVARLLPLGVPQDLVNGAEDETIPLRLGTHYVEKARAAGDRAVLHVPRRTGHAELILPESAAWHEAKALIEAALRR